MTEWCDENLGIRASHTIYMVRSHATEPSLKIYSSCVLGLVFGRRRTEDKEATKRAYFSRSFNEFLRKACDSFVTDASRVSHLVNHRFHNLASYHQLSRFRGWFNEVILLTSSSPESASDWPLKKTPTHQLTKKDFKRIMTHKKNDEELARLFAERDALEEVPDEDMENYEARLFDTIQG